MVEILERNVGEIPRFAINFLNLPLGEYQNFTALTSPGWRLGWRVFIRGHVICLPAKLGDMADWNAF